MVTDQELVHKVRGHREIIRTDTREALAAYFAGERLYEYIYPFSRIENPEKLNWRRFQTIKHYRNYPKEISRKYMEGLYRGQPITRQYGNKEFDDYLKRVYDPWFRRDVAPPSLYLPELFIVVTLPDMDGVNPLSRFEEDAFGVRPYPVVVYPQHVRDFDIDPEGNILWITFDAGSSVHCYTPDEFISANVSENEDSSLTVTSLSRQFHGFGRCPVVRIAYEDNASYADVGITTPVGHAMMKQVVDLSIADLQFRSMYIEMCYSHLFYKIVMGEKTAETTLTQGLGNDSIIIENEDEMGHTRYMPTPSFELQALKETIFTQMPAQIYQEARLRDHSVAIAQSGLAKTFDMVPETGVLSAIAKFLSDADNRIVALLAEAWFNSKFDSKKVSVTYPANFDVRTPLESLQDFIQFAGTAISSPIPTSPTAMREMTKSAQRALLPGANADMLNIIDAETDVAPFAPTIDIVNYFANGKPNTGIHGNRVPFQQFAPQPKVGGAPADNSTPTDNSAALQQSTGYPPGVDRTAVKE